MKIKFNNWEKYQPRKDYKHPWWFALSNDFPTNPNFHGFTDLEKLCVIYLLCEASKQAKNGEFEIDDKRYPIIIGLKLTVIVQTVDKLKERGICTESVQDLYTQNSTVHNSTLLVGPADAPKIDLEEIYREYPKRAGKQGRGKGLEKLGKLVKTVDDFEEALAAVQNYKRQMVREKKIGTEFVKQFVNFFDSRGDWKEWLLKDQPKRMSEEELVKIAKG